MNDIQEQIKETLKFAIKYNMDMEDSMLLKGVLQLLVNALIKINSLGLINELIEMNKE
ncbi:hypothetical protein LCGC14_0225100 [marine sediment metagenome]|uniref:Uncharacterized protein n=1 Tax=marine sediment metagenome TaxID=412755 RepID=A0A0F9WX11_9ZZZZ